jgi:hypothetical protein
MRNGFREKYANASLHRHETNFGYRRNNPETTGDNSLTRLTRELPFKVSIHCDGLPYWGTKPWISKSKELQSAFASK